MTSLAAARRFGRIEHLVGATLAALFVLAFAIPVAAQSDSTGRKPLVTVRDGAWLAGAAGASEPQAVRGNRAAIASNRRRMWSLSGSRRTVAPFGCTISPARWNSSNRRV